MALYEHERAAVAGRGGATVCASGRRRGPISTAGPRSGDRSGAHGRVRPVHRWLALVALASCEPTAPPPGAGTEDGPPPTWLSPPGPAGFPLGAVRGRLGRSQAPQAVVDLGLVAPRVGMRALHLPAAFAVPGDGPARAVLFGTEGDRPAIDLVEIDSGRVVWRDEVLCAAPVVGATADVIVCADASGARAIGLDGRAR